jgi:predicted metalloprotease
MRFRRGAKLDASQVSDRRGMGRGGKAAIGGIGGLGGIGAIIAIVAVLIGGGGGGINEALQGLEGMSVEQGTPNDLSDECQTGADANERGDCRIVGVVNSVQAYWADRVQGYQEAPTVFFTDSVSTSCGTATSAVGPFYCPADMTVYIDLGFYDELRGRFGATGGPFAEAYVIAHEYGHHVSNLTGDLDRSRDGLTGPTSGSVRAELQADCYAGAWAAGAVDTRLLEPLTQGDIADALNAAEVIGDDRIQETARGRVDPESWTHGSSAQRQRWFQTGYNANNPTACDTFSATQL